MQFEARENGELDIGFLTNIPREALKSKNLAVPQSWQGGGLDNITCFGMKIHLGENFN